jgi:hypothetical protein
MKQYPKSEVGYESPSKEDDHCSQCTHFEVLHHHGCERVMGTILPGDYCHRFFERKKSRMANAMRKAS